LNHIFIPEGGAWLYVPWNGRKIRIKMIPCSRVVLDFMDYILLGKYITKDGKGVACNAPTAKGHAMACPYSGR